MKQPYKTDIFYINKDLSSNLTCRALHIKQSFKKTVNLYLNMCSKTSNFKLVKLCVDDFKTCLYSFMQVVTAVNCNST